MEQDESPSSEEVTGRDGTKLTPRPVASAKEEQSWTTTEAGGLGGGEDETGPPLSGGPGGRRTERGRGLGLGYGLGLWTTAEADGLRRRQDGAHHAEGVASW